MHNNKLYKCVNSVLVPFKYNNVNWLSCCTKQWTLLSLWAIMSKVIKYLKLRACMGFVLHDYISNDFDKCVVYDNTSSIYNYHLISRGSFLSYIIWYVY